MPVLRDETLHPAAAALGEERHRRVRDMFARIAGRYELVNSVASCGLDRLWRRAVVRALSPRPGDWCLDACCGTGDLSRAMAAAGARVIGADFCRPMLAEGVRRRAAAGPAFVEADARLLPLRSASVDMACVAFGIRNVVPPEDGLRELARVVRPGGRVAVLEFSEPGNPVLRAAHAAYTRRILPLAGDLLSGSRGTYRYLPQTIAAWMDPPALGRAMEAAGMEQVSWRPLTFGAVVLHVGTVAARRAPPASAR